MHNSTILGVSLISMLFLATTTGISMQGSAISVSAFKVQAAWASQSELTDEQIICEECIKYWLNFLNSPQTGTLLNALINTINIVNFDNSNCSNLSPVVLGATCLTTGSSSAPYNTAQLFEICQNLKLALNYLVIEKGFSAEDVLAVIENAVKSQTNPEIDRVVQGLFDCFEEALLPAIFRTCEDVIVDTITGFNGPSGVAYDEENKRMYVTNQNVDTVSVIDTTTNTIIDTDGNGVNGITPITVGNNPFGLAYDAQKDRMYVANFGGGGGNTVSVINTTSFALIDTDGNGGNGITPITVASGPLNIAVDEEVGSNKIFVTHYTANVISTIDTDTFAVTPVNLPVGSTNSWGVEYHPIDGTPNDDTMYVTNFNEGNVFVYDSDTGALIDTILQADLTGTGPTDITYDRDTLRMYVTNFNSNNVSVIDTTTVANTVIDTDPIAAGTNPIPVGANPVYVAYDPINKDMYVTNQGGTTVSVIDTTTNTVIKTITVGNTPIGIAFDTLNHNMYVANRNSGTVSVIIC
ncbi:MAG: YncE family protein [Nitrososphaeraceae archaeon]